MDNGQLQRWALIAEIVSALAVLITLIMLLMEIRSNTDAMKIDTYDRLIADMSNWYLETAMDNELSDAQFIRMVQGGEGTTEKQMFLDQRSTRSMYMIYERAFLQWHQGNMDDASFARFRYQICQENGSNFEQNILPGIRRTSSQSFMEFRDQCLGE